MHLRYSFGPRSSSRSSLARRLRLGGAAALLLASSCSLVYDLSPDQCSKNTECAKFGPSYTCDEGVCVNHAPNTGGAAGTGGRASGGSGNRGGGGSGGTSEGGGTQETGGGESTGGTSEESGGSTSSGGSSTETGGTSPTGSGGSGNAPECTTHDDCFRLHDDTEPWGCIEGECKELTDDKNCPVLLPKADLSYDALRLWDAVIVGAFTAIDATSQTSYGIQNMDLAFSQINGQSGLPSGGGKHRRVVAVVCKNNLSQAEILKATDHLIGELKVPGILAGVTPDNQQLIFEQRAHAADTFMMVMDKTDDSIVDLDDDGLIYHMLAGPRDLAKTYQPLIDMTITHLQHLGRLGPGPDYEDARIALVRAADSRFLNELSRAFETGVEWNGKSAANNAPGAFVTVDTQALSTDTSKLSATADAVLAFKPHIVVGATDDEMTLLATNQLGIIENIESRWDDDSARKAQGRPIYVLSPLNYQGPKNALLNKRPEVRTRILGLNWPGTPGTPAYQAYKSAYQAANPTSTGYDGENYFDGAYFLTYGMVAAGRTITGRNISAGMSRITSSSGLPYDVGIDKLDEAFSFLAATINNKINLTGANGRPNWDVNGGRSTPASVWCIRPEKDGTVYVPDVLTYDESTGMLSGTFPTECFTFPAP